MSPRTVLLAGLLMLGLSATGLVWTADARLARIETRLAQHQAALETLVPLLNLPLPDLGPPAR
jgi:hypothetical protein